MRKQIFVICGLLFRLTGHLLGTPLDELGSPVQNVRDTAAFELRKEFKEIPETVWGQTMDSIHHGQTKAQVLEILRPYKVAPGVGMSGGGSYSESYRLDAGWVLTCWYENKGDVLIESKLSKSIKDIWVAPPEGFHRKMDHVLRERSEKPRD